MSRGQCWHAAAWCWCRDGDSASGARTRRRRWYLDDLRQNAYRWWCRRLIVDHGRRQRQRRLDCSGCSRVSRGFLHRTAAFAGVLTSVVSRRRGDRHFNGRRRRSAVSHRAANAPHTDLPQHVEQLSAGNVPVLGGEISRCQASSVATVEQLRAAAVPAVRQVSHHCHDVIVRICLMKPTISNMLTITRHQCLQAIIHFYH